MEPKVPETTPIQSGPTVPQQPVTPETATTPTSTPSAPAATVPPATQPVSPISPTQPTETTSPTESTPPVTSPPPAKKSRLPLLLIIVLLFVTLFAAGYFFVYKNLNKQVDQMTKVNQPTPTTVAPTTAPDPTATWTAYPETTFSIKLPPEWKESSKLNPVQFVNYDVATAAGREFNAELDKGKLKIEVYQENASDLTTYVMVQKNKVSSLYGPGKLASWKEEPVTLDGQPAIKVTSETITGLVVYTMHPTQKKALSISFGLDFANYLPLADQILSTFKFTE